MSPERIAGWLRIAAIALSVGGTWLLAGVGWALLAGAAWYAAFGCYFSKDWP